MSNTRTRRRSAPQRATQPQAARKKLPILPIVGGLVSVALLIAIIMSFGPEKIEDEFGSPVVAGATLPPFDRTADTDPAVGMAMPTVTGADYDGTAVALSADGRPKAIVFLAHWCNVCQREVPSVQAWLDAGNAPAEVDILSVSTLVDKNRGNYPASTWLDEEGWTPPLIVDDAASTIMTDFGGTGTPFWVFVDSTGTVVRRVSGSIDIPALDVFLDVLATS